MALGAAAAIAGKDDSTFRPRTFFSDRPACNFDLAGHGASRTSPGTAATRFRRRAGDARYQRGSGDAVTVSGDANLIQHVRVRDGKIELDCRGWYHDSRLAIDLPGRVFTKFGLAGSGSMNLNGIDQPDVKLAIAGSGDVTATGKTGKLDVGHCGLGQDASGPTGRR